MTLAERLRPIKNRYDIPTLLPIDAITIELGWPKVASVKQSLKTAW